MPTPIVITPQDNVLGPQASPWAVNSDEIGDPNIVLAVRIYDITAGGGGDNGGDNGGGGSTRPTSGMIYPRGQG